MTSGRSDIKVSVASNNGSAFAGLGPNLFYEIATVVVMVGGRFLVMVPTLALASCLAARPTNDRGHAGAFSTDNAFFAVILIAVIVLVGALTFLPADLLGPIAEHFVLQQGRTF